VSEESEQRRSDWMDEAESALERIGDSLRQAWTDTRDARLATLEAAKEAASQLGEAIDQGIDVVRETWSSHSTDGTAASIDDEEQSPDAGREEE